LAIDANAAQVGTPKQAHAAYVDAINAKDLGRFVATVTDDVAYLPPNSPPVAGRAAVEAWATGYLVAYRTH